MEIEKAIKHLEDYHQRLPRGVNDDYIDAIGLGIEALKRLEHGRLLRKLHSLKKLPGETEE